MKPVFLLLVIPLCILLCSCGNPYDKKIIGALTQAEIDDVSAKLPDKDRDLFTKWAKRQSQGEHFGGEGVAKTVKEAITFQMEYDARAAKEAEIRAQERAAIEKAAKSEKAKLEAERQRLDELLAHRTKVHEFISQSISNKAQDYRLHTDFDRYGRITAQRWVFNVEVTNKTKHEIMAAAGYLSIKDPFGKSLGSYPFEFEINLAPGKVAVKTLWMADDPNDPNIRRFRQGGTLFTEWFFQSLVFRDGSRIDGTSVPKNQTTNNKITS